MGTNIISSKPESLLSYLKRLWQAKGLVVVLAKRELKAKYAQTVLGIIWTIIQPLIGLLVFTVFFDRLIDLGEQIDIAYPLFAFSGMVSWYYFTYILAHSGTALVNFQHLITKINLPKLALPLSHVLVGMVEFGISLALMFVLMLLMGQVPEWQMIFLPIFIVLNIITGLAVGIWLSALTIRYRDFHHIIPYLVNFGIWLTPVFYPSTIFPEKYSWFIYLNPMAGVIAGFRWCLLGDVVPSPMYFVTLIPVILLFVFGINYFRKVENIIVDLI